MITKKNFLPAMTVGFILSQALGCSFALDSLHPVDPTGSTGNSSQSTTPVSATQIDYAMIKTQVIEPNCYECHSAGGGNKGGVNLESYQNVKANLVDIQADLADDSMPDGKCPLSTSEKALVNAWISQGAPETIASNQPAPVTPTPGPTPTPAPSPTPAPAPTPSPTPAPSVTTYQTVNSQVIQPYCLSCHSAAGGNRAGVNLENYTNVLKNISGVKSTINSGSMPRGATLTSAQKKLILDWIAAGAPQSAQVKTANSSVQIMTKAYVDFMTQQNEQPPSQEQNP